MKVTTGRGEKSRGWGGRQSRSRLTVVSLTLISMLCALRVSVTQRSQVRLAHRKGPHRGPQPSATRTRFLRNDTKVRLVDTIRNASAAPSASTSCRARRYLHPKTSCQRQVRRSPPRTGAREPALSLFCLPSCVAWRGRSLSGRVLRSRLLRPHDAAGWLWLCFGLPYSSSETRRTRSTRAVLPMMHMPPCPVASPPPGPFAPPARHAFLPPLPLRLLHACSQSPVARHV